MQLPFREHHLLRLLEGYSQQTLPLDLFISYYFRDNPALGSKDRAYIADTTYSLIRWQLLIDHFCKPHPTWKERLEKFQQLEIEKQVKDENIPLHIRYSFPKELFDLIVESHGNKKALQICLASNHIAPTTVRANLLKTTRENLLQKWQNNFEVSPCHYSQDGIIFHKKTHFFSLPEFKEGLFEVQDEGSQLLAHLVQAKPGERVLDYCSGSGGKTLAFAPQMQNKGQIYLHDIRPQALVEAKKRLKRAGIQNAQLLHDDEEKKLKQLKKQMDWVLVDAPCTGTGTMRRNPDMKWKFTTEMLERLTGQQRTIFEKALSFLKPTGKIVYATCSILKQENDDQLEHFKKVYQLQVVGDVFRSIPEDGKMDGFFGVILSKI